ncbi:hypothetical protein FB45DRAFT_910867 [Roridomyces roridus]|uniref:F-box domain-containing protein n=1 Tax=Roridomyces roridus TaxID=1738132 RepID=A0AAD7FP12_9AGAR|nr:hypothetical protein FB45DRAFT_910867 [Roridomyces roridus]
MQLALELLQTILSLLERPELLVVRMANQTLRTLATPLALQEVGVRDTVASAERFIALKESASQDIIQSVRTVVFRDSTDGWTDVPDEESRLVQVPRAMSDLNSVFPQLTALRLEFTEFFYEDVFSDTESTYWLKLQHAILEAVTSTRLKSLTLYNLITMPSPLFASDAFAAFLSPLETLDIETLGPDTLTEGVFSAEPLDEFWAQMGGVLSAAQSVSSLRLHSHELLGSFPTLTLPIKPFPNLTSLHLTGLCAQNEGIESFLLLHASTLQCLTLNKCPLYGDEREYARPWAAVIHTLDSDAGLTELVELNVDEETMGYCYVDPGWGIMTTDMEDEAEEALRVDREDDLRALEAWREAVERRRMTRD